jgi:hypothetical protein
MKSLLLWPRRAGAACAGSPGAWLEPIRLHQQLGWLYELLLLLLLAPLMQNYILVGKALAAALKSKARFKAMVQGRLFLVRWQADALCSRSLSWGMLAGGGVVSLVRYWCG